MKVALLTDSIEAGSPGIQSYAAGLAAGLSALADGNEYRLVHRRPHPWYEGTRHEIAPSAGEFPLLRQLRLPPYLEGRGFDLVHDTYHFGPFLRPSNFARVLTIHDLTPLVTRTHRAKRRWAHRLLAPVIAHRAHAIVTVSECSKRDIVRLFRVAPERITVTYQAASERFRPLPPEQLAAARARLGLPARYFLHVGTIEPRKNVERLVRAYAAALPQLDGARLVLVGKYGWGMAGLPALLRSLGLAGRVVIRDDIGTDDLPFVYNGATALAYPSLYEGFGLPPLEAMQCGVPVIASNVSSLPEVTGDAAIQIDPISVDAIASALIEVCTDRGRAAELSQKGVRRAARFTWQRCAETTLSAYAMAVAWRMRLAP